MPVKEPLKDQALNVARITRISCEVQKVFPEFDAESFIREATAAFPQLVLKDRIAHTSQALHTYLAPCGSEALAVLLRSLPPTPEAAGVTNDFGLHIYSPHSDYVARYCRSREQLDEALDALKRLTPYFSAEVAVRHFLARFPNETMNAITVWARDPDYRVRRLASESTRPKLPWALRIPLPLDTAVPVLDRLYADDSPYVISSVANHLRDIATDDPELALATLKRWKDSGQATPKNFALIARDSLRNTLKLRWTPAYAFLGYERDAPIDVSPLTLDRTQLVDGDTLTFSAVLTTTEPTAVHVLYVISSTTPSGAPREKFYFLKRAKAQQGKPLALSKAHKLRSTATMKITPGAHSVALQINGRRFPATEFLVLKA